MNFHGRKSGIALIGALPWGSRICQFYQTKADLLDLQIPYLIAGLKNNEFCVWVTSKDFRTAEARQALQKALPRFERFVDKGQIEIISYSRWRTGGGRSARGVLSLLDKALAGGFDGLRVACGVVSDKNESKCFTTQGFDSISRNNVIVLVAHPRDSFDALGLMEVVKNHRFALVRNAGRWEVLESAAARIMQDALQRSEDNLKLLFSHMAEGFAYHRIMLDAQGKPYDFVFLEVNHAFERLTGLDAQDIVGKTATKALPGIERDPTGWIAKFGEVALTGKPVQFESYSEALKRWYSVSAFSAHQGYFAVTFSDISERKRSEEALRESEDLLKRAQEISHLGSWELDLVNNRLAWSDEVYRIFGFKPQEFGATYEAFLEAVHPDDRTAVDAAYSGSIRAGQDTYEIEHRVVRKSAGEIRYVLEKCQHFRDETGKIIKSVGMVQDITKRKQAEKALKALSDSSQAVIRANDELEYLNDVCRIIVDDCGYSMVWIGFAENNEAKSIRPVAYSGFEEGYLETLRLTWADTEWGQGLTGTAIRTGNVAVCRHMLTDPAFAPWREEASKRGYASSIVFPLRADGRVFGAISIYSKETAPLTVDEIRLLTELTDNVAYGIEVLRTRTAQKQAEELAAHLASFPQLNPNPVLEVDSAGRITFFNPATVKILETCEMGEADIAVFIPADVDGILASLDSLNETILYREIVIKDRTFEETIHLIAQFNVARIYVHDITERKKEEEERASKVELLRLVNEARGTDDLIKNAAIFFQAKSGCEAIGIRLKEVDDYPYSEARGFPKEFILAENSLCTKDAAGDIVRDNIGNPVLACMCGSIICGRFDPMKNFFSKGGSFWTNSTTKLLASTTAKERKALTRNRCHGEGYESVALIPLYVGEKRLGLIQLNDRRPGMFTAESIALWETLGGYLSIAMMKFQAEEDVLRMSEDIADRNQELKDVNRELEAFAYSVSHDLRAPLRAIDGFSKILLERYHNLLDEKGGDYLKRVRTATQKMAQLIDDLLRLSRLSRGGMRITAVDLSLMAGNVETELRRSQPARQVSFMITEGLVAQGDQHLLTVVLDNLLGNAWKFTSKKGQAIIEFSSTLINGTPTYFVRDNGAGFDMTYADKLFGTFQRLHLEQDFPGTGIGLSLVQRIIHRHGGKVWAEGAVGQGATFYFTLPPMKGTDHD